MPIKCFEFKILYSSCRPGVSEKGDPSLEAKGPYLPSGIYDLGRVVLPIVLDDPAEGILNCRVIAFNEVMLNEANRERRFAYIAQNFNIRQPAEQWNTVKVRLLPTERLPTIAIFRCFGAAGILNVQKARSKQREKEWVEKRTQGLLWGIDNIPNRLPVSKENCVFPVWSGGKVL